MLNPETQRFMAGRMGANLRPHSVDHSPMWSAPHIVVDLIVHAAGQELSQWGTARGIVAGMTVRDARTRNPCG